MIPAGIAAVLAVISLIIIILVGVGVGLITSRALRQAWGARDAAIDAALTGLVAIAAVLIVTEIDAARGTLQSRELLVGAIAVGSIALRHVLRRPGSNG